MGSFRRFAAAFLAGAVVLVAAPAASAATASQFRTTVQNVLAGDYQPAYVPVGNDSAFSGTPVPNTFPTQDYTSGSVEGNPDYPGYRPPFVKIPFITSPDGAKLWGWLARQPGSNPGVVVVHGFNTRGKNSVVRWAHLFAANGYNVLAVDQRMFREAYEAEGRPPDPPFRQTIGWKEAEDVLAAGRYLNSLHGVTSVGVFGFSAGAQNTILALALDGAQPSFMRVFDAAMTFSGPASQNTQIYSTAVPPNCFTPACTYPVSGALIELVVPPYRFADPCQYFNYAAAYYGVTPYFILSRENAFKSQLGVKVPLFNLYAEDDPLVRPFNATMMAGYNGGMPLQRTAMLRQGAHAYFYDRWWQQRALLIYFKQLLPGAKRDASIGTNTTVNKTPGGTPAATQLVPLGSPSRHDADDLMAPYICDTSQPPPGS